MNRGLYPGWNRAANGVVYPAQRLVVSGAFTTAITSGSEFSGSLTVDWGLWPYRASLSGSPPPELRVSPVLVDGARWKIAAAGYGATGGSYSFGVVVTSADGQTATVSQSISVFGSWSATDKSPFITLSNGNTTHTTGATYWQSVRSANAVSSGKRYVEMCTISTTGGGLLALGIGRNSSLLTNFYVGGDSDSWGHLSNGYKTYNGYFAYGSSWNVSGDICMMAWDPATGYLWFGKNGVWFGSGDPVAGTNPTWTGVTGTLFVMASANSGAIGTTNFGSSAFVYSAPAGFAAWNS